MPSSCRTALQQARSDRCTKGVERMQEQGACKSGASKEGRLLEESVGVVILVLVLGCPQRPRAPVARTVPLSGRHLSPVASTPPLEPRQPHGHAPRRTKASQARPLPRSVLRCRPLVPLSPAPPLSGSHILPCCYGSGASTSVCLNRRQDACVYVYGKPCALILARTCRES